jgi:2-dehydro-3-deoxygluconokinase
MTRSVVTLGEALIRLSVSDGRTLASARSLELLVGGAEANVAVALARLGKPTTWISRVSRDPLGQRIVAELRSHGVNCDHVSWVEQSRTGVYYTEIAPAPRGVSVVYDRRGSAATGISIDNVDLSPADNAAVVQVSGVTAALGDSCAKTALALLARGRASGAKCVVDVNFRAKLWSAEVAASTLQPMCAAADVVVCTSEDAADLFGVHSPSPEAVGQLTKMLSAPTVALTDGANGVWLGQEGGVEHFASIPTTTIDRVGAGDAFCAGLIAGILENDLRLGVRLGQAMASLKLTMHGDHFLGTMADVERILGAKGRDVRR